MKLNVSVVRRKYYLTVNVLLRAWWLCMWWCFARNLKLNRQWEFLLLPGFNTTVSRCFLLLIRRFLPSRRILFFAIVEVFVLLWYLWTYAPPGWQDSPPRETFPEGVCRWRRNVFPRKPDERCRLTDLSSIISIPIDETLFNLSSNIFLQREALSPWLSDVCRESRYVFFSTQMLYVWMLYK